MNYIPYLGRSMLLMNTKTQREVLMTLVRLSWLPLEQTTRVSEAQVLYRSYLERISTVSLLTYELQAIG